MKISVVIPTRNRPDWVEKCIEHLLRQDPHPFEILVVDASSNRDTTNMLDSKYHFVKHLPFYDAMNQRHESKNIGFRHSEGDIVAFLDDDSLVQDGWLKACLDSFVSPDIGCVGGRVIDINDPAGDEKREEGDIGKITYKGVRINNFHRVLDHNIDVDHLRGGNIAIRKEILENMGGYDSYYTGTNVFEETDVCLRIKKLGYRLVYNSKMLEEHHFAPREKIQRYQDNFRTAFYIVRNGAYGMLVNCGFIRGLAFVLMSNTGIPAFLKTFKWRKFVLIFISLFAKICGFYAWVKSFVSGHRRGPRVVC